MTSTTFEVINNALYRSMRELPESDIAGKKAIQDELDLRAIRDYAEKVREMHFWVATRDNAAVCASGSEPYEMSRNTLIRAIELGWGKSDNLNNDDVWEVYHIWADCSESIAYCVNWYVRERTEKIRYQSGELAESGELDKFGNTDNVTRSSISAEYPELDKDDVQGIFDVWLACNQTISYCYKWYMRAKSNGTADMAAEHAEIAHKPHLYTDTYNQDELDIYVAMRMN